MRAAPLLALATLTGLSILYFAMGHDSPPEENTSPSNVTAELAELRSELAALRRTQSVQQTRHLELASAVVDAQDRQESVGERRPSYTDDVPLNADSSDSADAPPSLGDLTERLEESFADLPTDPAWTPTAMATATADLTKYFTTGAKLDGVECRKGVCRAELVHTDLAAMRAQSDAFTFAQGDWRGAKLWALVSEEGESPARAVVYLARDGQDLAALAPKHN